MKVKVNDKIAAAVTVVICLIILLLANADIDHSFDPNKAALRTEDGEMTFDVNAPQIADDRGFDREVEYSKQLLRMKNLTSLELRCENELGFLNEFQSLEKLCLRFDDNTELLATLPYMPNLRELTVSSFDREVILDKAFADNIPNVEVLWICAPMKNDFSALSGLTKLTEILYLPNSYIKYNKKLDTDLTGIDKLPSLECLKIDTTTVVTGYELLSECAGLKKLEITVCNADELNLVMSLDQIEELQVLKYGDEYMSLNEWTNRNVSDNLKTLTLRTSKINVDSIDFISRVPNLTKLNVYKNCISEENVSELEDMGITVYLMDS